MSGADSEEEAKVMYKEAQNVMAKGGFQLSKWNSNKDIFDKSYDQPDQSLADMIKVLGLKWIKSEDSFAFDGIEVPTDLIGTKRILLSFKARYFDPPGFTCPFTMKIAILFQTAWKLGLEWDDPLPAELQKGFSKWLIGLEVIKTLRIPRCYNQTMNSWTEHERGIEVHAFSDASPCLGYGCCIYLRFPNADGSYSTTLAFAKGRVAPLKPMTTERLELVSCQLTASYTRALINALRLPDNTVYRCWTDSMIALYWIKGEPSQWKPFICNRVINIQRITDPACWSFVSGKENPADLVSRGMDAEKLVNSELFYAGPPWLKTREITAKPEERHVTLAVVAIPEVERIEIVDYPVVKMDLFEDDRWGTYPKALRVVGWALRFVENARKAAQRTRNRELGTSDSKNLPDERVFGDLSVSELSGAQRMLFRQVQHRVYYGEIERLSSNRALTGTSSLNSVNPMLVDGLLRTKSRLEMSQLSYAEKYPVILPKCHLARLLLAWIHHLFMHPGVNQMLTIMRNSFWIIGARYIAKRVKKSCFKCQRQDSRPCNEIAAPLPKVRVTQAPPFTVTGLDFGGPLYCIDQPQKKLYFAIFTCAVIRAVHLELTDSQSIPDFMLALRRFIARRRHPRIIYSDNAKTFLATSKQLTGYLGPLSPDWKPIVPKSPWWGGWWERLVGSVKSCIKKTIGKSCLTRVELETSLHEAEACINSRPLTFVGDEIEYENPLTPNHFLMGLSTGTGLDQDIVEDPENLNSDALHEREIFRLKCMMEYWKRWSNEYLRNLPTCVGSFKHLGTLRVGAVVMIREDRPTPKMRWPLGVVTKLIPGRDGVVRVAEIKTTAGLRVRDIRRLHNLELYSADVDVKSNVSDTGLLTDDETSNVTVSDSLDAGVMQGKLNTIPVNENRDDSTKLVDLISQQDGLVYKTRSGRISKPPNKLNI